MTSCGTCERLRCGAIRGEITENVGFRGLALGSGLVEGHGGANEGLQRLLVYLLALVEVDGTPCVPLKTGVEEARRILQSRPFGEGHLHDVLVGLACADQSVVRPHWNASPLPLLDDFGIGFLDQGTEPAEHHAAPVAELLDSRVYQLRSRLGVWRPTLLHERLLLLLGAAAHHKHADRGATARALAARRALALLHDARSAPAPCCQSRPSCADREHRGADQQRSRQCHGPEYRGHGIRRVEGALCE